MIFGSNQDFACFSTDVLFLFQNPVQGSSNPMISQSLLVFHDLDSSEKHWSVNLHTVQHIGLV